MTVPLDLEVDVDPNVVVVFQVEFDLTKYSGQFDIDLHTIFQVPVEIAYLNPSNRNFDSDFKGLGVNTANDPLGLQVSYFLAYNETYLERNSESYLYRAKRPINFNSIAPVA